MGLDFEKVQVHLNSFENAIPSITDQEKTDKTFTLGLIHYVDIINLSVTVNNKSVAVALDQEETYRLYLLLHELFKTQEK